MDSGGGGSQQLYGDVEEIKDTFQTNAVTLDTNDPAANQQTV